MENKVLRLSLVAIFSVLLFAVALFNRYSFHAGQIIFAIIFTIGVLLIRYRGCAISITFIAGIIYSFTSALGFLIITSWIVRGATVDLLFSVMRIYSSKNPSSIYVSIAMSISSLTTGFAHYMIFVKLLHLIPELAFHIILPMILIAATLTGVGSFLATKYLYRRIITVVNF